ncbi:MAG: aldo/keto reductase [Truepera sp.]|nr:aldo/keto reductase [Truepera sp.]
MTYRQLGNSGLFVYPIALGTMQFGWTADEPASIAILDAFVAAGGNLIDTADIYSTWAPNNPGGVSEAIIGRYLASRQNRDRVLIATKVRGAMGAGATEGRNSPLQREGLSRKWILQACEDSLRRLQVDYIDLYQVHFVDQKVPIEETLSALTDLVRRGYVRYLGASNYSAWRLMQALWASDKHGYERFVSIQPEYSIASPTRETFERELAKVCATYQLGVLPYSPLAGGFLTGKYRRDQPLPDSVRAQGIAGQRFSDKNWQILDALSEVAARHGVPVAQVALAWQLHQPFMTAPIIGANSVAQLQELLPAATLSLEAGELEALNNVSSWEASRTERES